MISPNFLVRKFCGKTQANCPRLCGNCAFPQYFHTRKLGEITAFYAVSANIFSLNVENFWELWLTFFFLSEMSVKYLKENYLETLKVHSCRFENLPICSCSDKNNTLKISHSYPRNSRVIYPWSLRNVCLQTYRNNRIC